MQDKSFGEKFFGGLQGGTPTSVNHAKILSNLLAVIHSDGGHYEDEHGTVKASQDAMERVSKWMAGYYEARSIAESYRKEAAAANAQVLELERLLTQRAADLPSATCPRCKNSVTLDSCPFCNFDYTASR